MNVPTIAKTRLTRRSFSLACAATAAAALAGTGLPAAPVSFARAEGEVSDDMVLGVVSFQPVWGDVEANLEAMAGYVEQAGEQGVQMLLFPEMCVTGYISTDDPQTEDWQLAVSSAEAVDGPVAQYMSGLAREHGMWLVYGATEPVEGDPDHAYNSAFVCSPEGGVTSYQKIHPVEGAWCVAGCTPVVFDTPWGKVGVDICYDTYAIPELERYYAAMGCRLILNPTATSRGYDAQAGDSTLWQWYFEARVKNIAIRDGVYVASANLAGYDGMRYTLPAGSSVFGPSGEDGATTFVKCYVGDTADQEPGLHAGSIDLSLAGSPDILASDNFRPALFGSWYEDLADDTEADLVAPAQETTAVVSVVNFQQTFANKEANFQSMCSYIAQAAEAGTNILVFPEMALTGYAWSGGEGSANGQAVVDCAEPVDGEYALALAELAAQNDMYIVFGTAEPIEGDSEHAYNSAFVCTPQGEVATYRKIAPVEGLWCVAGSEPLIVETPYGAMGISICKDTYAYPEIARYYMAKGCVYLVNPTARTGTLPGWAELYQNSLENLADQDKMIVVSADLCGPDLDAPAEQAGWDPYTGASVVTVPLGAGEDGSYVRTWGSYKSDPEAVGMVSAVLDYEENMWLGQGEAIWFFDPELYAALYAGEEFEPAHVDLLNLLQAA